MNKTMPNGEEVLIFKSTTNDLQEGMRFIKGTVIGSYEEKEEVDIENAIYRQIYTVYGEDGEEYKATHNYAHKGDFYIRTIDEHIDYLSNAIFNNNCKINELKYQNKLIREILSHLYNCKQYHKTR